VAVFGGDGTVMEVAQGVLGSPVPLAILPGGSANLMAVELGIPKDLEKAAGVVADLESPTRQVDVCLLGEKTFLLRVGMGFSARKVEDADRDLKDRYGVMAYSIASVKALKDSKSAHYRLRLDDEPVEADGVSCQIDNAGNMGIQGVKFYKEILVDDGLMDVIVIGLHRGKRVIQHWQARQIEIETDPPQPVQVDGEMTGVTPVSARIMPGALNVLVPKPG
jgi:diacylglycerol kinase family enzyme